METFYTSRKDKIKEDRLQQLALSIALRRHRETSDVTLVCGGVEFYAHKVVLEASSAYFATMLNSGFTEAASRKVDLPNVDPATIQAILEYIYLGEIQIMSSEEEVKMLLAEAHMMRLMELFNYCCSALEAVISTANYFDMWAISVTYENTSLKEKVMDYSLTYFNVIRKTNKFLLLSDGQLKEFVTFCKNKGVILDQILQGLIDWLLYDLKCREDSCSELFACVDVNLLTVNHTKSLLRNNDIMKSSTVIESRMNALGVALFLVDTAVTMKTPSTISRDGKKYFHETILEVPPSDQLSTFFTKNAEKATKTRLQQLALNLDALRTAGTGDVVLVCADKELYAHKVVLEASSPFFVTMINSGQEESTFIKVVVNLGEPEALAAILEYIYIGEVKPYSEEELKKIVPYAHAIGLKDLFSYCCSALEVIVSVENVFELWAIGQKYENQTLESKVMDVLLTHFEDVKVVVGFCEVSFDQLQQFLKYAKDRITCFDKVLHALIKWLIHDTLGREMLSSELFRCVDVSLVSKLYIKCLVGNVSIMNSSVEIANRINELSVTILLCENMLPTPKPLLKPTESLQYHRPVSGHRRLQQQRLQIISQLSDPFYNQI